ncbi:hypothetical protein PPERSA_02758 [Pseudocohnilembus persalinus]|uniref:Transmembrane protein n=1 Tax=Pseudocohnilembus persalinus TaxID=266149 RepID=A0A0V0Q8N9_PSEPJ|nr:hypothetical protein PPERSA_02758 [Pseudocohnilembus persalinus]|eukprot:KRW98610.1 hypothetical protein PPERSA_02758 [Pseudocohnilembus persalinus]
MVDIDSSLSRYLTMVRFGWVVCLVSSIIRIALNIFITFQPKEQGHNKSYQDQDYWSIIIFSFGFFGDLVPSFYILKMFDPQWRKQQQMQQEFFVKKENLGNEELEDFNEQYDYSFNNIDDSEEENEDSFGNGEYQQNQNSGEKQKQTNSKVSSKNSSRKKK